MRSKLMYWAVVVVTVVLGALPAAANSIRQANATDDCSGYTLSVAGKFLAKATTVSFTITLTPTSGTPIVVTDSIPVTPAPPHGTWSGSITQTWAHYSATLNGKYTVTGSATLNSKKPHTRTITFSTSPLECTVQVNSCLPTSSLGILVQAPKVISYVPNGAWATSNTGLKVVQIEPAPGVPAAIATPSVVNSCSSNSVTGETVCSSNGTDVYLISGTTLNTTLTSGADQSSSFSGGSCKTCGVVVNALANQAVLTIGLSTAASGSGIQFLDLASNTFAAPVPAAFEVSEDVLWDQGRNLVLSPSEQGVYDLFQTSPSSGEFGNAIGGVLDSAAEDCTTGIALSTDEFTTQLYIADLTQATLTPGLPGSWTSAQQFQNFPEFSGFAAGTNGIAVAPGTHLAIVTGEFGGNAFGAIQLPSTSGVGAPAVVDYAAAILPNTPDGLVFEQGLDPHTVTAYLSPNSGKSIGVIANGVGVPPTYLAVIDLQGLLNAPRVLGTHTVDPTYDLILNGIVSYVATF